MKRSPIISILVLIIIMVGCGVLYLWLINSTNIFKRPSNFSSYTKSLFNNSKATVIKVPSKLDGVAVDPNLNTRHPLGVMIENHPDARPQFGLSSASIVYEAIAEGGITRFLAVFGPNSASKIGPIRSARTYYADWCNEYDCYYAHVGGAQDAVKVKIPTDKIKDIDQFANGKYYHREPKPGIATEHTMFSSTDKLYELAGLKKWGTALRDDYSIYTFLDDPTTPAVATAKTIKINFSTASYEVDYTFDATTNSYTRNLAGKPHIDAQNQKNIAPKNIIIQYIGRTAVTLDNGAGGCAMPTVGSGKAEVYQNRQKIVGTWKKSDKYDRTEFYDEKGGLIKLYRGPTWIEIINPGSTVTSAG